MRDEMKEVVNTILMIMIVIPFISAIIALFFLLLIIGKSQLLSNLRIYAFFSYVIILISLIFYQKKIKKRNLSEIGIKYPKNEKRNIIYGLILTTILIFIAQIIYFSEISFKMKNSDEIFSFFTIIMPLLVVIAEEIGFRGYIQSEVMDNFGKWKGIFITSILFSCLNFLGIPFYSLSVLLRELIVSFFLSVFFCHLYSKNRNLLAPIISHFYYNMFFHITYH